MNKVVIKLKTPVKQKNPAHIIGMCIHTFLSETEAQAYLLGFREGRATKNENIDSIKINGKEVY